LTRAQPRLPPAQLREDLALLRRVLEAAHPGLYRYTPKQKMDALFRQAEGRLRQPMSPIGWHPVIARVLAGIRCGHTSLAPSPALAEVEKITPLLPLRASFESGRAYVLINESAHASIQPGQEILTINGHSVKAIAAAVLPHLVADGDIETGKHRGLGRNLPVHYFRYLDQATTFDVKLAHPGRPRSVRLDGVLQADRQKNATANPANAALQAAREKLDWAKDNIALRFLNGIANLRIGGFGGRDFPASLEKQFAEIRAQQAPALVLDLRGNGGGNDDYGALLVSYLTSQPFRYFERIRMTTIDPPREHTNFDQKEAAQLKAGTHANAEGGYLVLPALHNGLNEQQPQKNAFLGKVAILTDGGSFSTCADACAVLHHLRRATFIGEETGGGYYGNNSGASLRLTLPHSKTPVNVPLSEYWNQVPGYPHKRRGTLPDHPVPTRIADTLAGRDAALDKALAVLR